MNSNRKTAMIVGVLFILGFAGILSAVFVKPVLDDPGYLIKVSENQNKVTAGALSEIIMAFACAGIAMWLYPVLKRYDEALALGSVGFRIIEAVFLLVAALGLLSLLTVSRESVKAGALAASAFQSAGALLLAARFWSSLVLAQIAFGLGALMYYFIFYRSKLIPRWLSAWGLMAMILHLTAVFITMLSRVDPFSTTPILLLSIPIALQEMVLAIWLIVKGFDPSAMELSLSATPSTSGGRTG